MHYYQFNIADFNLHTAHLTLEEDAVYRRLIDFYYDTESPIPEETKSVIRRLRLGNYSDIVDTILNEYFTLEGDGWHNYRCDIEISAYKSKAEKARQNGKKGGRPPKDKGLETQLVNSANPEITGSKANQELLTNNHKPVTNKNTPSESVDSCPHQQIIDLYHSNLPTLRRVKVWSDKRKKALRTRWREDTKHQSLEFWEKYFRYVSQSTFLIGNNTDWQADIEWLINPGNFVKVVEGKYHEQR